MVFESGKQICVSVITKKLFFRVPEKLSFRLSGWRSELGFGETNLSGGRKVLGTRIRGYVFRIR